MIESHKAELSNLIGRDAAQSIQSSILTSYYTKESVIQFVYRVLDQMGVCGTLNILDPAMGTGNFFRLLPKNLQNSNLYGVELDTISAKVARQLFQTAHIQNCGFEDAILSDNYFDLVIGNVPFGDYSCKDMTFGNQYIHDYFFLKAVSVTRPRGIIAMITTKGTMDKKTSKCRKMLNQRTRLLCGFRLPTNAFEDVGANVTTDILFFQKTEYENTEVSNWVNLDFEYNSYFYENPQNVFGEMVEESGPFGTRWNCKLKSEISLEQRFEEYPMQRILKKFFIPLPFVKRTSKK